MAAGVLGNCARPAGGNLLGRASANRGDGALIGGQMARAESRETQIVGMSPTPGRAIANAPLLKSGRDSIR